jgi:hypothetical protein
MFGCDLDVVKSGVGTDHMAVWRRCVCNPINVETNSESLFDFFMLYYVKFWNVLLEGHSETAWITVMAYVSYRPNLFEKQSSDHSDNGGSTHLWNVGLLLWDYTPQQPRRLFSSYSTPWEREFLIIKYSSLTNITEFIFTVFGCWVLVIPLIQENLSLRSDA